MVGCGKDLNEEKLQEWAQSTLNEMDDFYLTGNMVIGELNEEKRNYQVEERHLSSDKSRIDLITKDHNGNHNEERQVFIYSGDQLKIYHQGLEEQYHISEPRLNDKFSFLYIDFLNYVAQDKISPTIDETEQGFKLETPIQDQGINRVRLSLDKELKPTNLELYRNDNQEPYLQLDYQEVRWNESVVNSEDFQEPLLERAYVRAEEKECELSIYCEKSLEELDLGFTPVLPDGDGVTVESMHPCEHSNWISMQVMLVNDQDKNTDVGNVSEQAVFMQGKQNDFQNNEEFLAENPGYNEKKVKGQQALMTDDDAIVMRWFDNEIEFVITGENEQTVINLAKILIN